MRVESVGAVGLLSFEYDVFTFLHQIIETILFTWRRLALRNVIHFHSILHLMGFSDLVGKEVTNEFPFVFVRWCPESIHTMLVCVDKLVHVFIVEEFDLGDVADVG